MENIKDRLRDSRGNPLTQSLFLENGYQVDAAIYTLKDEDHTYKGVVYPSIKRIYLDMEDVVEYEFANTYFLGWNHWKRLYENKLLTPHIDSWREELRLKLRSAAFKGILDATASEQSSFQAHKWLIDEGWLPKSGVGRPATKEKEKEEKFKKHIASAYGDDIARLTVIKGNKE